jgi:hypothetical protein
MADEKVTNSEAIRLRRRIEVRDLALAVYYPRTQIPLPAITPHVQFLQQRQRDAPSPPENVAKPWKKPWDK